MEAMLLSVGAFLVEHAELVNAVMEAIEGGATKEQVLKGIRASMVAAGDVAVEAELGPRPKVGG